MRFKELALKEGLPWGKWTYQEKEHYRKRVRLEQDKQRLIGLCKENLNENNSSMYNAIIQAKLDELEYPNKYSDPSVLFMHQIDLLMKAYVEEKSNA